MIRNEKAKFLSAGLLLACLVQTSCYGPALSQRYVCEDELQREGNEFSCVVLADDASSSVEADQRLMECLLYVEYLNQNKCKNKSEIVPWWL